MCGAVHGSEIHSSDVEAVCGAIHGAEIHNTRTPRQTITSGSEAERKRSCLLHMYVSPCVCLGFQHSKRKDLTLKTPPQMSG